MWQMGEKGGRKMYANRLVSFVAGGTVILRDAGSGLGKEGVGGEWEKG